MIGYLSKMFQKKSTLLKKLDELEHENDALDAENFELAERLEEMHVTMRCHTLHVVNTHRTLEAMVLEIDTLKTESRKLYYHTKEMISNARLVPAGELAESLNIVERLTRSDKDANA